MEYKYVNSSQVKGVAYDQDSRELFVQFTNGSEYKYNDVPYEEYSNLASAPSVGSYLNQNIKGVYSYERV
jgi:hypothetical protein